MRTVDQMRKDLDAAASNGTYSSEINKCCQELGLPPIEEDPESDERFKKHAQDIRDFEDGLRGLRKL